MTANWNLPTLTSNYTDFITEWNNKLLSAVTMNLSGDSNIPANAIQYDQSAKRFKIRSGGAWVDLNIHDVIPNKAGSETITGAWQHNAAMTMNAGLYLLPQGTQAAPGSGLVMWNYSGTKGLAFRFSDGSILGVTLEWTAFTPSVSVPAGMTITRTDVYTKYCQIGKTCFWMLNFNGTIGGLISPDVIVDTPFSIASATSHQLLNGTIETNGTMQGIYSYPWNTSQMALRRLDQALWNSGAYKVRAIGYYDTP
jgi:hypothetical protein